MDLETKNISIGMIEDVGITAQNIKDLILKLKTRPLEESFSTIESLEYEWDCLDKFIKRIENTEY